jgi:hypothetical protein
MPGSDAAPLQSTALALRRPSPVFTFAVVGQEFSWTEGRLADCSLALLNPVFSMY